MVFLPDRAENARSAVAALACDQGPYLIEWVAYHRAIGFDRVIVASHDCTDGSDALLDALQAEGHLTHLRVQGPGPGAPFGAAMWRVWDQLRGSDVIWLLPLAIDEFLHVGPGQGHVRDLLAKAGEADVIALPCVTFGENGHQPRSLPVLPNFTACEGAPKPETVDFRSMFRHGVFRHATPYMPVKPQIEDPLVLAANGSRLNNTVLFDRKGSKYRPFDKSIKPRAACINHYATRSRDDVLLRNAGGQDGARFHIGGRWHTQANRNASTDRRILRNWPATEAMMASMRAAPSVLKAEQACLAADDARRALHLTPANRRAWTKSEERAD